MNKKIKKVGVIGAGVMGATIAAQLATSAWRPFSSTSFFAAFDDDKKKGLTPESQEFRINWLQTVCRAP